MWLGSQRLLNGFLAVNLPIRLRLNNSLQAGANDLIGVRDQNTDHGCERPWALDQRASCARDGFRDYTATEKSEITEYSQLALWLDPCLA